MPVTCTAVQALALRVNHPTYVGDLYQVATWIDDHTLTFYFVAISYPMKAYWFYHDVSFMARILPFMSSSEDKHVAVSMSK